MNPGTTQDSATAYGLRDFVSDVESILDRHPAMPVTIKEVSARLYELCRDPRWLPRSAREPRTECYARHLLHKDRQNRFVVLALVWLPGQATPIHDHSCWGVMGIVENTLQEVVYERLDDGSRPGHAELRELQGGQVSAGSTSYLLPPYHEIHAIGNNGDRTSISIHVYGRDIDEVNVFEPHTNSVRPMRIKYFSPECGGADFAI
ncbi:MAG: cysteine dioxygenase family protein [Planctomycetes bacterium]|nr:cysteine dioxygenase family protein [Planctomycetota bacterium]